MGMPVSVPEERRVVTSTPAQPVGRSPLYGDASVAGVQGGSWSAAPLVNTEYLLNDSRWSSHPARTPELAPADRPLSDQEAHTLELDGNLDALAKDWTQAERKVKRRLVQLQTSQSGSTISASFKVASDEPTPQSICVSCILWEAKDEYFVTGPDIIRLLQFIRAAGPFSREEKKRIRQNLQRYSPFTISKTDSDSKDIFEVIADLPAPKPINIRQDVKIFSWKVLSSALEATYQSLPRTASAPQT